MFDEKNYWRQRHDDHNGALKAVGIDTVTERGNQLAYQLLADQYGRLLDRLALPAGARALDAGAGVGAFTRVLHERGFDVTALDISQTALDGIDLPIAKVCSPIAAADLPDRSFDYVHSFDVLYHVMSDAEWAASLEALCRWSSRYVVLHERFLRLPQWMPSKIMKMRPRQQTIGILERQGLRQVDEMPTYFLSKQLLTYRVAGKRPDAFYKLDAWALGRHSESAWVRAVASHRVKVFERQR
ncbi:class I SAM-dependent methyltransferase [Nocardioides cavernae]|uniref:Class I SAM-dependent methyltransferase n=1 Tax=Nocardioides cavernae TaxID=1921566 RepID=A0ABR8NEW7_9ACTN|nr:class I SAM-dependent methyltransferase [Nocardioides cavernae]MBD3926667.1 class I SAM-dependent methyltransferase [Nocardioides cavernae]MBM7512389.1 SAM-dependent methyltransferase [Nocardioides cavernae]